MYSAQLRQLPLSVDVLSPDVFDRRHLLFRGNAKANTNIITRCV